MTWRLWRLLDPRSVHTLCFRCAYHVQLTCIFILTIQVPDPTLNARNQIVCPFVPPVGLPCPYITNNGERNSMRRYREHYRWVSLTLHECCTVHAQFPPHFAGACMSIPKSGTVHSAGWIWTSGTPTRIWERFITPSRLCGSLRRPTCATCVQPVCNRRATGEEQGGGCGGKS